MTQVAEERHGLFGGRVGDRPSVALTGYLVVGGGPVMWVWLGIAGLVIPAFAIKELMTLY